VAGDAKAGKAREKINIFPELYIRQKFVKKTFRFCVIFGLFRKTAKDYKRPCLRNFFVSFRIISP
jgi:hypothetical protein